MDKNILIIGNGSSSKTHFRALKLIDRKFNIKLIPSRKFNLLIKDYKSFLPNYIILSSPASEHYKQLLKLEQLFKGIKILIEKPLFDKYYERRKKLKNRYFVGYNLRYHPVINFIKKKIENKKIYFANVICSSYLPSWRNKINYTKSVSAQKKLGGGLLLELSHEIDYINLLFGIKKIVYSFNKKISNLKINVDDFLCVNVISKKNTFINLIANFFSKIEKRNIFIEGDNFSLEADLISNEVVLFQNNKKKIFKWSKFKNIDMYIKEHLEILRGNYSNICKYEQGNKILKYLENIRKLK